MIKKILIVAVLLLVAAVPVVLADAGPAPEPSHGEFIRIKCSALTKEAAIGEDFRITSYNVCYTKLLRTSLVVIIALYDLLKTTQSILGDPRWMGFAPEAYIFVAMIYFICCFYMSIV